MEVEFDSGENGEGWEKLAVFLRINPLVEGLPTEESWCFR